MNRNLVSKENDRICKGFYDQVYTQFKYSYVPGMTNLFEILPRHAYSWVPNKIKSSEELSDKLANDLKGKDLTQRRNVPYSRFKQDYCSEINLSIPKINIIGAMQSQNVRTHSKWEL